MMKGKRKIARGLLCLAAFIRVSAACGQIAYASDISLTLEGSSGSGKPMEDRKSTRLNSSHIQKSRMPSSA